MALPFWVNAGGEEKVGLRRLPFRGLQLQPVATKVRGSIVCREERETTRRITEYLEMLIREGGLALKATV